jgi:hypothetical protein
MIQKKIGLTDGKAKKKIDSRRKSGKETPAPGIHDNFREWKAKADQTSANY